MMAINGIMSLTGRNGVDSDEYDQWTAVRGRHMNEDHKFREDLYNAVKLMRKRRDTSNEEYFAALKKYGVDLSEETIIADYRQIKDVEKLDQMYYDRYGRILDDKQEEKWLNSDAFMELLDRIVPQHFDIEETGDPYFITSAVDEICRNDLRKVDQKTIEKVLRALVTFSRTRDQHLLDNVAEFYDFGNLLKELIRVCHNRDQTFRALIRQLYECYEDMDPKIFPSVYKEYLNQKNMKKLQRI